MPEEFKPKVFNTIITKLKTFLPTEEQKQLEDIKAQVSLMNDAAKISNFRIKALEVDLNKRNDQLTEVNQKLNDKSNEYNTLSAKNKDIEAFLAKAREEFQKISDLHNDAKKEISKLTAEIARLNQSQEDKERQYTIALKENRVFKAELARLNSDLTKIRDIYNALKAEKKRPIATPTQLSTSFRNAMEAMNTELKTGENSPVDYVISKFDIDLKTAIGIDDDDKINFQLPKVDEIKTSDQLSTIQFSIKSVPKIKINQ